MSWVYNNIKSFRSIGPIKECLDYLYQAFTTGGLALGDTSETAYRGDYGKIAYDHSIETAITDPHGSIAELRGGVNVAGDTLQKLYELILSIGQLVGDFNASGGTLPTTGTGISGGIDKGDIWQITTGGTLPVGVTPINTVTIGDALVARISNPTTAADFYVIKSAVGQATSSVLGILKLYTDLLSSNTDGTVTQAVIVTAITNLTNALSGKQATLVSGTSLKTVGNNDLLGNGDIQFKTVGGVSIFGTGNIDAAGGSSSPANAVTAGIVKLYTDLTASNVDGTVTQLAIKNAIDALGSYTPGSAGLISLKQNLGLVGVNTGDRPGFAWVMDFAGVGSNVTDNAATPGMLTTFKILNNGNIVFAHRYVNGGVSGTYLSIISPSGKIIVQKLVQRTGGGFGLYLGVTQNDTIIINFGYSIGELNMLLDYVTCTTTSPLTPLQEYAETADGLYFYTQFLAAPGYVLCKVNKSTLAIVWTKRISAVSIGYAASYNVFNIAVTPTGHVIVTTVYGSAGYGGGYVFTADGIQIGWIVNDSGDRFVTPLVYAHHTDGCLGYTYNYNLNSTSFAGIIKFNGELLWGVQTTTYSSPSPRLLCDDIDGNVYFGVGSTSSTWIVDRIYKYDKDKKLLWVKTIAPAAGGTGFSMCCLPKATSTQLIFSDHYNNILINLPADGNYPDGTYGPVVITTYTGTSQLNIITTIPVSVFTVGASSGVDTAPGLTFVNTTLPTALTNATDIATTTHIRYPIDAAYLSDMVNTLPAKNPVVGGDLFWFRDIITGALNNVSFTNLVSSIFNLGGTLGATLSCNDQVVSNPVLKGVSVFQYDFGTINATSPVNVNVQSNGNWQTLVCGGNYTLTVSFTNWPSTGLGYVELMSTNMGLGSLIFADTIYWKLTDDTFTTSFATYLDDRNGQIALKTSGIDRFVIERINSINYGTLF